MNITVVRHVERSETSMPLVQARRIENMRDKFYNQRMDEKLDDGRFVALEMKVSYTEDFLNQLQDEAVKQSRTIEKLQTEIKILSQKVMEMSESLEGDVPNRIPPHY